MIRYAVAPVGNREFSAHWMPAFAGMTAVCGTASYPYADAGCLALASIWPMASTTASKVSMVEAWRAL
jgi:hypothetical protein